MAPVPYYKPARLQLSKRYVKFLSVAKDPKLIKLAVQRAPDSVIKGISNAALNIHSNPEIRLTRKQRQQFRKSRNIIDKLVNARVPIPVKRKLLVTQKGGALPLIPIILSTALSALGSLFLPK